MRFLVWTKKSHRVLVLERISVQGKIQCSGKFRLIQLLCLLSLCSGRWSVFCKANERPEPTTGGAVRKSWAGVRFSGPDPNQHVGLCLFERGTRSTVMLFITDVYLFFSGFWFLGSKVSLLRWMRAVWEQKPHRHNGNSHISVFSCSKICVTGITLAKK